MYDAVTVVYYYLDLLGAPSNNIGAKVGLGVGLSLGIAIAIVVAIVISVLGYVYKIKK